MTGNVGVIERKKKGGTSLICKRVWPPAAIADRDWPGAIRLMPVAIHQPITWQSGGI